MKKLLFTIVALTLSSTAWAAKSVRVDVNGMVCSFCAAAIEKKLSALPEAKAVYVNLEKKIVAVELKDGKSVKLDTVKAQIVDAGYDVVKIAETDQSLAQIKAGVK